MNLLDHLNLLMPAYVAYVVAIASPGPSNMAILELALRQGRKPALALAAGVVTASWTWAVAVATGLSTLLVRHPALLDGIKLVGGAYLLWLGWRSACAAVKRQAVDAAAGAPASGSTKTLYVRGLLMHLANPKAVLGWAAVLTIGLARSQLSSAAWLIVLGCALLSVMVFSGYAIAFSVPLLARGYLKIRRALQAAVALVFVLAGIRLVAGSVLSLGVQV